MGISDDSTMLTVRSDCIDSDGRFRTDFTGRGRNISPKLRLDGLDPSTRTLAVTLEDLTHPLFGSMAHPSRGFDTGRHPTGSRQSLDGNRPGNRLRVAQIPWPETSPGHDTHLPVHRSRARLHPDDPLQNPPGGLQTRD